MSPPPTCSVMGRAVDDTGAVTGYNEYDPYGNPVENGSEPYGSL